MNASAHRRAISGPQAASFTGDFSVAPFWWGNDSGGDAKPDVVPGKVDVAIVGSGVTGLSAAITLARNGAEVAVLDSERAGFGGSTRSAGVIGRSFKKGFSKIQQTEGLDRACAIYGEAREAFDFILDMIAANRIECGLRNCGRLIVANSPAHYSAIERDLENKRRHLRDEYAMVPPQELHREIGTEAYSGGAVIPDHKTLDPHQFHKGLLSIAQALGVRIVQNAEVTAIEGTSPQFQLSVGRSRLVSRNVIVATNGYTGRQLQWFRRRLVPIDAYMIATEPLPDAMIAAMLPTARTFNDYRMDTEYARLAPDGRQLIFGALTGRRYADLSKAAIVLRDKLVAIFPQLGRVRIARCWTGRCAGAFDFYPHLGQHAGLHYSMGYCFGSGLPLGMLFGHKIALRILGRPGSETAFDGRVFQSHPLHTGSPWFMPILMEYYRWRARAGF